VRLKACKNVAALRSRAIERIECRMDQSSSDDQT